MKAEVYIENNQNKVELSDDLRACIAQVAEAVLEYEECNFDAEIDVTITDNENIRVINLEYRNKDMPTDVLSFPILEFDDEGNAIDSEFDVDMDEDFIILGDIVISLERASEQAQEYGHSLRREVGFLTAHSMLHLLGYDHENNETEARTMQQKEEEILQGLGITRE